MGLHEKQMKLRMYTYINVVYKNGRGKQSVTTVERLNGDQRCPPVLQNSHWGRCERENLTSTDSQKRGYVSGCMASFGNDSFSWSQRWCKADSKNKELRRYDLPVKGERTPRGDFESMDPFKVSFCGACSVWLNVGNATNDSQPPNRTFFLLPY